MQRNPKPIIENRVKILEVNVYVEPQNQQVGGLVQNCVYLQHQPNPLSLNDPKHSRNPKLEAC